MIERIIDIYYNIKIMLAKKPVLNLLLQLIAFIILGYMVRVYLIPTEYGYHMLVSSYRRLSDKVIRKTKRTLRELAQAQNPVIFVAILVNYIIFILLAIIATIAITLICCCGFK